MRHVARDPRFAAVALALLVLLPALLLGSCGESGTVSPTAPVDARAAAGQPATGLQAAETEHCAAGGTKDETAPFTFTATGQAITSVCVKAGTRALPLTASDDCYTVSGLPPGTTVTVTKTGSGSRCKDISYVTFYTSAPTATPTPTLEATGTPTNTPTDTPTPTPTNTPTDTPTPTATSTPTNTPTDTPTPTPTGTPTDTPTPTYAPPTPTPTDTPTPPKI